MTYENVYYKIFIIVLFNLFCQNSKKTQPGKHPVEIFSRYKQPEEILEVKK